MSELNTVVHFSPVRFYFTMMVLNFIFIVHPTNASVEFLQLNPAHNDDKYVPGRRQGRILEDRKLLVIWQLCGDIIQSSQSWLWPSTMQWSKQGLMWPEKRKQNHHQYWFWDKKWNNCHIFQDHLEGIRMVREGWKSRKEKKKTFSKKFHKTTITTSAYAFNFFYLGRRNFNFDIIGSVKFEKSWCLWSR